MRLYERFKGKDFTWKVMKIVNDDVWINEQPDNGQPNELNELYHYTKQEIEEYVKSGFLVSLDTN